MIRKKGDEKRPAVPLLTKRRRASCIMRVMCYQPYSVLCCILRCKWNIYHYCMETETVKPPKVLPNMLRKVMPGFVVATKYSQGKKDLGDPISGPQKHHSTTTSTSSVVYCFSLTNFESTT